MKRRILRLLWTVFFGGLIWLALWLGSDPSSLPKKEVVFYLWAFLLLGSILFKYIDYISQNSLLSVVVFAIAIIIGGWPLADMSEVELQMAVWGIFLSGILLLWRRE